MTAKELARKIEKYGWGPSGLTKMECFEIAEMLRNQQAKIERLTQENCDLWEQLNDGKASEK